MKDTARSWFKEAKYGLFIHWGLYSVLAGEYKGKKTTKIAEWIENTFDIPVEEYRQLAGQFDPVRFDADELVRRAKEDWGMKYICFTSKHHEGFAMFDSQCNDYNIVKATPYGKDIVKALANACRKYDMKFCLYYSQAQDWDDPDGFMAHHDNTGRNFQKYFDEKCKPQVKEILTNYGEIAMIWFDTPMGITVDQTRELIALVKSIQPDCLLNGRTGSHLGDYITTGDNFLPRFPIESAWEVPATINNTWGYNKYDNNWKTPEQIIRKLLRIVSRGGNYLLNIGPRSDGTIPEKSIEILDAVGRYVKENAEAIYGTDILPSYAYEVDEIEITGREHKLYLHVLSPMVRICLVNIGNTITNAYLLKDGRSLEYSYGKTCEGDGFIQVELPEDMWEESYFCVCVEMEEAGPVYEDIL